jgi:hypothetical protein
MGLVSALGVRSVFARMGSDIIEEGHYRCLSRWR